MDIIITLLLIAKWVCMIGGLLTAILGIIGLYKFKDIYTKQHAASLIDSATIMLISISLVIHNGFSLISVKIILLALVVILLAPPISYTLMQIVIKRDKKINQ